MRPRPRSLFAALLALAPLAACGLDNITQGGTTGTGSGDAGTAAQDAGPVGEGCGVESQTGITLCVATSLCPEVVVDTQSFPHCGFRIVGGQVDLVCGCSEAVCSMGAFSTCAQAAQLLTGQTEAQVCTQVAEGRCLPAAGAGTSSSGGSSGGPNCS